MGKREKVEEDDVSRPRGNERSGGEREFSLEAHEDQKQYEHNILNMKKKVEGGRKRRAREGTELGG